MSEVSDIKDLGEDITAMKNKLSEVGSNNTLD